MRYLTYGLVNLILFWSPAQAELRFSFQESAPKDRFVITNNSGCALGAVRVEIDLSTSTAGLIFDTTGSGAGVNVFQPFELVEGDVRAVAQISDGDNRITLDLDGLSAGGRVVFTTDVDDTKVGGAMGPTMIAGSEIAGARASASMGGVPLKATFGSNGLAIVPLEACLS